MTKTKQPKPIAGPALLIEGLAIFATFDQAHIDKLSERLLDISEATNTILATAQAEKRDLTKEEQDEFDSLNAEFERVSDDLDRFEKAKAQQKRLEESRGRVVPPAAAGRDPSPQPQPAAPARQPRIEAAGDRGKWGFRTYGEYAMAVMAASNRANPQTDPRLIANAAPSTYSSESIGADGGFLVPPDFRADIMAKLEDEASLLGLTDQLETSSNNITFPKDETTPWQSTGGIQAFWEDEAQVHNQSKVAFTQESIRLNKLSTLVPVTEEQLDDAPGLDGYLRSKTVQKMSWKINDAIVNGSGVGRPLGLLNSAAKVTVTKEGSQAAGTILAENIFKMYSRMYAPLRGRAVWLINQDIEPQLFGMTVKVKNVAGTENVGGSAIYIPPGGLNASPYGLLFGRPVIAVESCQTLGTEGDIIFTDLKQYRTIQKVGGPRAQVSMHLWFDYDMAAFKVVWRLGGQSWWTAPITPANGTNSRSCIVTLQTR